MEVASNPQSVNSETRLWGDAEDCGSSDRPEASSSQVIYLDFPAEPDERANRLRAESISFPTNAW
jgi:hypothetical protein